MAVEQSERKGESQKQSRGKRTREKREEREGSETRGKAVKRLNCSEKGGRLINDVSQRSGNKHN